MENLSENAQTLEKHLPEDLEYITDSTLRKLSGLNDPEYSRAKKELVRKGLAKIGRGRGGPIRRVGTAKQQVLSKLPKDGSFISNHKIYESLDLSPEEFSEIQKELIDEGRIIAGKGRYGRSARVAGLTQQRKPEERGELGVNHVSELYGPVKDYFDSKWRPNYDPSPPNLYISEITATQAKRNRLLTVPDISILTIMKYDFVPGNHLELVTIDVKKHSDMGFTALYETASQSLYSHRSYLVFEWIKDKGFEKNGHIAENVLREAKRFGVGLIQMRPIDSDGWNFKTVLEPRYSKPEPGELNSFIDLRFREEHARIRGALD